MHANPVQSNGLTLCFALGMNTGQPCPNKPKPRMIDRRDQGTHEEVDNVSNSV